MKVTLLALGGLLAAASFCACNNNDDNTDTSNIVNAQDSNFVMMAGMGNTAEIRAADSALAKSTDSAIRNFATMMVADHSAAQTSLKAIATNYGLTVPDSIDAAHAAIAATLS